MIQPRAYYFLHVQCLFNFHNHTDTYYHYYSFVFSFIFYHHIYIYGPTKSVALMLLIYLFLLSNKIVTSSILFITHITPFKWLKVWQFPLHLFELTISGYKCNPGCSLSGFKSIAADLAVYNGPLKYTHVLANYPLELNK